MLVSLDMHKTPMVVAVYTANNSFSFSDLIVCFLLLNSFLRAQVVMCLYVLIWLLRYFEQGICFSSLSSSFPIWNHRSVA